ncbi:MAG: hypothetical protein WCF81_00155 [Roseiarcus sp.]
MDDFENGHERSAEGERSDYFHAGNLDRIRDAPPNASATVHRHDVMTMSELARRGFHLVDMSGEIWTMRRAR